MSSDYRDPREKVGRATPTERKCREVQGPINPLPRGLHPRSSALGRGWDRRVRQSHFLIISQWD